MDALWPFNGLRPARWRTHRRQPKALDLVVERIDHQWRDAIGSIMTTIGRARGSARRRPAAAPSQVDPPVLMIGRKLFVTASWDQASVAVSTKTGIARSVFSWYLA